MRVPGIPYVQGRNSYSDVDSTKYAIAIHNTSNTATAEQEASYATRRTDGISAHFYVDRDSVIQSLDTKARAGHAGSSEGNNHAVAVEITGVNSWTRQQWLERVAWDKLGQVLSVVCQHYGIEVRRASVSEMRSNPRVRAFYGHDDMRRAWGGTTHTDPGPNFPWDRLMQAVKTAMEEDDMPTAEEIAKAVWGIKLPRQDGSGAPAGTMLANGFDRTISAQYAALRTEQIVTKLAEVNPDLSDDDLARIRTAVEEELGEAAPGLAATLAPQLVTAVREELGDLDDERVTGAVERGVRKVLGELDEQPAES